MVPLYNKAAYVERALASISAQQFGDFEAIVVDDGSTDGSSEIVRRHPDSRFRLIRQDNQGPGLARNAGLKLAQGSLIAFLDADDEWLPDYLQNAVRTLRTSEAAAYACSYIEFPEGISTEPLWRRRGLIEGEFQMSAKTSPILFLHSVAFLSPCTTVSRTDVLRRWGGFYARSKCTYGEDAFLWLKVLLHEKVALDLSPHVRLYRDAADLSKNLDAPHPLEPFLEYPEDIRMECPVPLRHLLESFYSIRAFKTACIWGLWGRWREAQRLRREFRSPGDFRMPYFWASRLCTTPLGPWLGKIRRP